MGYLAHLCMHILVLTLLQFTINLLPHPVHGYYQCSTTIMCLFINRGVVV